MKSSKNDISFSKNAFSKVTWTGHRFLQESWSNIVRTLVEVDITAAKKTAQSTRQYFR